MNRTFWTCFTRTSSKPYKLLKVSLLRNYSKESLIDNFYYLWSFDKIDELSIRFKTLNCVVVTYKNCKLVKSIDFYILSVRRPLCSFKFFFYKNHFKLKLNFACSDDRLNGSSYKQYEVELNARRCNAATKPKPAANQPSEIAEQIAHEAWNAGKCQLAHAGKPGAAYWQQSRSIAQSEGPLPHQDSYGARVATHSVGTSAGEWAWQEEEDSTLRRLRPQNRCVLHVHEQKVVVKAVASQVAWRRMPRARKLQWSAKHQYSVKQREAEQEPFQHSQIRHD